MTDDSRPPFDLVGLDNACASCSSQEGGKLDYFVPQFYFLIYML